MHTTRARRLHLVAFSLALSLVCSCGSWVKDAYVAAGSGMATLTAAVSSFESFDHDYQLELVRADKKKGLAPEAIAQDLDDYRAKRLVVTKCIADLAAIVQTGKSLLVLAEHGTADKGDVATWVADLFKASYALSQALHQIGAGPIVAATVAPPQGGK